MTLSHVSLFSGVGMMDLAFDQAGIPTIAACEIDAKARGVIADHHPDLPVFHDVKEVTADELARIGADPARTVLTAGWPCQDASVAGGRRGFDGDRTSLWREVARILGEWSPAWFVGENVPGLLSVNGGRDFAEVVATLGELGYGYAWRVMDAQHFGVPQRRRRLAIVAHRGDTAGPGQVLLESEGVRGNPAAGVTPGTVAPRHAQGSVGVCGIYGPGVAGTVTAQGLTDHLTGGVPIVSVGGDVTHTLTAGGADASEDGTGRGTPIIVAPNVAATLTAGTSKPGVSAPGRRQEDEYNIVVHMADMANTLTAGGGSRGYRIDAESAAGGQLVAFHENKRGELRETEIAGSLSTPGGKPGQGYPAVRDGMTVRRLTPREEERLMGLPDDWTLTSDGKRQSDSARYHQIGNGLAVPMFEWIARRIMAVHEAARP